MQSFSPNNLQVAVVCTAKDGVQADTELSNTPTPTPAPTSEAEQRHEQADSSNAMAPASAAVASICSIAESSNDKHATNLALDSCCLSNFENRCSATQSIDTTNSTTTEPTEEQQQQMEQQHSSNQANTTAPAIACATNAADSSVLQHAADGRNGAPDDCWVDVDHSPMPQSDVPAGCAVFWSVALDQTANKAVASLHVLLLDDESQESFRIAATNSNTVEELMQALAHIACFDVMRSELRTIVNLCHASPVDDANDVSSEPHEEQQQHTRPDAHVERDASSTTRQSP
jgi:hypothetical protein